MKKRYLALLVIVSLFFFSLTVSAETTENGKYIDMGNQLKELGLFKGSNNGFELDRAPTRLEAGVMLIRLLGKEDVALQNNYTHPFLDVPNWGSPYVGYMFKTGLTNGIKENQYGSNNLIDAKSYTTFVLRALGYNDQNGDFTWNESLSKGKEIGLLGKDVFELFNSGASTFLRDHMVYISYQSLNKNLKGKNETLIEKLMADGVVDITVAVNQGLKKIEQTPLTKLEHILVEGEYSGIGWIQGLNKVMYNDGFIAGPSPLYLVDRERVDKNGKTVKYTGANETHMILEYNLFGLYKNFTGILSPSFTWEYLSSHTFDNIGSLKIYGDNKLLFEDSIQSNEEMNINIDITDVYKLRIEFKGEEIILANPTIK